MTPTTADMEARRYLALLCIGRLGEHLDVTGDCDIELASRLKNAIDTCFEEGSEDIRSATAFALGRLAVGSMSIFLPIVLEACSGEGKGDNKHQYLLLVALKETIVVHVSSTSQSSSALSFTPYLETVLPGLLNLARNSTEEGVRNMVAECLGALASTPLHTERITCLLQDVAGGEHENKLLIWTVVTSMRFYFSRVKLDSSSYEVDPQSFLTFLQDSDLDVRRATLLMVNAAVHYTPSLILPHLEHLVLPHLLVLLSLKQRREVQMGPFKHIVDDALPLRKSALTCFETMLYVMPEAINPSDLLTELTKLVQENLNETNLQCHQILCKLCSVAPSSMLCALDDFTVPLEKTIAKYDKMETGEGSAGPEKEKALEQVRSCIRLISTVNKMDDLDVCPLWQAFVAKLPQKPAVAKLLAEHEGQKLHE
jgi:cullin-associated NEDD8-dissociated protein 1